MLYRAIRPLLFRLDPERAHNLVFSGLVACEWLSARFPRPPWSHPALEQELWSIRFPNPVGLAAGFDKNARAPHVWPWLGFGLAELATLTALAQAGNPPPRIMRLPRDHAIINRLGFNNSGAVQVARRLAALYRVAPPPLPIGINIGKSRATALDAAPGDYCDCLRHLFPFADYVVINISSPNTPGLRDLQAESHLAALVAALTEANDALAQAHGRPPRPLLVKVAPDVADDTLAPIVDIARTRGVAGLVATNTTIERTGLATPVREEGGLSGAPLRDRATAVIRRLRARAGAALPIIGVGGIFTAADAYTKIRAGASLVQIYTGMIFEGPRLAHRIGRGLLELLRRDGFAHLREAVGRDA